MLLIFVSAGKVTLLDAYGDDGTGHDVSGCAHDAAQAIGQVALGGGIGATAVAGQAHQGVIGTRSMGVGRWCLHTVSSDCRCRHSAAWPGCWWHR